MVILEPQLAIRLYGLGFRGSRFQVWGLGSRFWVEGVAFLGGLRTLGVQ